jgi:NAD(P) transhydrogenase subunit alpha
MPWHGSTLYSRNLTAFVLAFLRDGAFRLDLDDEIIKGCLVTHGGEVRVGPPGAKG